MQEIYPNPPHPTQAPLPHWLETPISDPIKHLTMLVVGLTTGLQGFVYITVPTPSPASDYSETESLS